MIRKSKLRRRKKRKKSLPARPKPNRRIVFRRACRVASSIKGSLTERTAYALGYLGSHAGFGWEEIKRMLGGP